MPGHSNRLLSTGTSNQTSVAQQTRMNEGIGRSPLGPSAKPPGTLPLAQCLQQHGPPEAAHLP
eukprot:5117277-Prorocentrum_lima.AAC.1